MSIIALIAEFGEGGTPLNLTNATLGDSGVGTRTAEVVFNTDGSMSFTGNTGDPDPTDEWFRGQPLTAIGDNFWVYCDPTIGGSGYGPDGIHVAGTAYQMNSTRNFRMQNAASQDGVWTFEIRASSTGSAIVTASFTVSVVVA